MERVCVIGLGYIGLPTAVIIANSGFSVIGFDIDSARVDRIRRYDPVIKEPEIADMLKTVLLNKKFEPTHIIEQADYFIVAVPTPFCHDKTADLSYVWQAADSIASVLRPGNTIILESTVPVGTTELLAQKLAEKTLLEAGVDFFVAHCPERVLPGKIVQELINNGRVIGGINAQSNEKAKNLYACFVKGVMSLTNAKIAEVIKLIENSYRDVQIAFANQIAELLTDININPFKAIELANKHPRINILQPSCGVGGHCISVDPWFLIQQFPEKTSLLKSARSINDQKPEKVIKMIHEKVLSIKKTKKTRCTVALLGATYKPDVDDLRESPALYIARKLQNEENLEYIVCEPNVDTSVLAAILNKKIVSLHNAISQADLIVCLVKHSLFKTIPYAEISEKIIFDVCGLFYRYEEQETQKCISWKPKDQWSVISK